MSEQPQSAAPTTPAFPVLSRLARKDVLPTLKAATGLTVFTSDQPPADFNPAIHSRMEIMGVMGDVKLMWDRNKPHEVEAARTSFNNLIKQGYSAFKVIDNDGNKGEKIKDFDPNIERMILVGPIQGG